MHMYYTLVWGLQYCSAGVLYCNVGILYCSVGLLYWNVGIPYCNVGLLYWSVGLLNCSVGLLYCNVGLLYWCVGLLYCNVGLLYWCVGLLYCNVGLLYWRVGLLNCSVGLLNCCVGYNALPCWFGGHIRYSSVSLLLYSCTAVLLYCRFLVIHVVCVFATVSWHTCSVCVPVSVQVKDLGERLETQETEEETRERINRANLQV